MGEGKKQAEIDIFEQLEEALEERLGKDRRQKDLGANVDGKNRRKGDRRQQSPNQS